MTDREATTPGDRSVEPGAPDDDLGDELDHGDEPISAAEAELLPEIVLLPPEMTEGDR